MMMPPMKRTVNTMLETAVIFNNLGVDLFHGQNDYRSAWDLFKGALEMHLAIYMKQMNPHGEVSDDLGVNNAFIKRAETIVLQNEHVTMISDFSEGTTNEADDDVNRSPQQLNHYSNDSDFYLIFGLFRPYLYASPFTILQQDTADYFSKDLHHGGSDVMSIISIFNLALVEHIYDRTSERAISLYKLTLSLLKRQTTKNNRRLSLLKVALVNNVGVWCYENDDHENAQKSMECLSQKLQTSFHSCHDNERSKNNGNSSMIIESLGTNYKCIMRNVEFILAPQGLHGACA